MREMKDTVIYRDLDAESRRNIGEKEGASFEVGAGTKVRCQG